MEIWRDLVFMLVSAMAGVGVVTFAMSRLLMRTEGRWGKSESQGVVLAGGGCKDRPLPERKAAQASEQIASR